MLPLSLKWIHGLLRTKSVGFRMSSSVFFFQSLFNMWPKETCDQAGDLLIANPFSFLSCSLPRAGAASSAPATISLCLHAKTSRFPSEPGPAEQTNLPPGCCCLTFTSHSHLGSVCGTDSAQYPYSCVLGGIQESNWLSCCKPLWFVKAAQSQLMESKNGMKQLLLVKLLVKEWEEVKGYQVPYAKFKGSWPSIVDSPAALKKNKKYGRHLDSSFQNRGGSRQWNMRF